MNHLKRYKYGSGSKALDAVANPELGGVPGYPKKGRTGCPVLPCTHLVVGGVSFYCPLPGSISRGAGTARVLAGFSLIG